MAKDISFRSAQYWWAKFVANSFISCKICYEDHNNYDQKTSPPENCVLTLRHCCVQWREETLHSKNTLMVIFGASLVMANYVTTKLWWWWHITFSVLQSGILSKPENLWVGEVKSLQYKMATLVSLFLMNNGLASWNRRIGGMSLDDDKGKTPRRKLSRILFWRLSRRVLFEVPTHTYIHTHTRWSRTEIYWY